MVHKAVVEKISADSAIVRLTSGNDCGGCRLSTVCGGASEQTFEIDLANPEALTVGSMVEVLAVSRARLRAIWLFAVAPLLSLVGGAFLAWLVGGGEAVIALGAIGAVGLCFMILYLLRARLSGDVVWKIIDYD